MVKILETAVPADVLATMADWAVQRAQLADEQKLPPPRPWLGEELTQLLDAEEGTICAKLASDITSNAYTTRIWLKDTSPALQKFLKYAYRNREVLDILRGWAKKLFGDRIRVEGDPDFTGLYFDLA
jgi:hypothetical protein